MIRRNLRLCGRYRLLWHATRLAVVVALFAFGAAKSATAADLPGEAAIKATAEEFTKAFDRGDAKALAALWTAGGTMTDEQGATFAGRTAIEEQYAALFKSSPGARIKISITSIELPTPGVAIEEGQTSVAAGDAKSAPASRYRAVHLLENGKWLMTSVRETPAPGSRGVAHISQLAWLVGKWQAKAGDAAGQSEIRWIADKSFLQRDYTVRSGDRVVSSGTQIIGVDSETGQLRSWSFDSTGGSGGGLWSATPDGWQIDTSGRLADGTRTSSRDFVIRVAGEDSIFGWRSLDRKAGTVSLPDTPEVVLERVVQKP